MPTATDQVSSVSHHLLTTKKILRDVIFDPNTAAVVPAEAQVLALERDAFEVFCLIRCWRNTLAPINKIPPEVLALIPDFFVGDGRDRDVIALTHVCKAWREIFISRSSLWTDLDCKDTDKTRVYLERSKSLPVNVRLTSDEDVHPRDPFFQIATGRLGSLSVHVVQRYLPNVTAHLSHPAPLLRKLVITGPRAVNLQNTPALTPGLFGGDLSSLRDLRLSRVRTGLQWRNMANLTTFVLARIPRGDISIEQLLDFFESAPRLCNIELLDATPISGAKGQRLVSLASLKDMKILEGESCSSLLDHLLIPVGAKLKAQGIYTSRLEGCLPRSLDNLRNLPEFTNISLFFGGAEPGVRFTGPNGQVSVHPRTPQVNGTWLLLGQLDTSRTKRLRAFGDNLPLPPSDAIYPVLLSMTDLRTLTVSRCENLNAIIDSLSPNKNPSGVVVCPKLEELVLNPRYRDPFNFESSINMVVRMVAVRAARGAKLECVRIVSRSTVMQWMVPDLAKHVSRVECVNPEVDAASDDSDGGDSRDYMSWAL